MSKEFDFLNDKALVVVNDREPVQIAYEGEILTNLSAVTKQVTGVSSVSYESEYKKNLLELDIEGNTEQQGTPTPTTPQEIVNASGLSVELKGKNLTNINDRTVNVNNLGKYVLNTKFVVEPSTTYTFAFDYEFLTEPTTSADKNLKLRIAAYTGVSSPVYRSSGKLFPNYDKGRLVYNFTTKSNLGENVNLFFGVPEEDAKFTTQMELKNCILVKGNYTELPYEPYFEPKTVSIPSEVALADGTVVPLRFAKAGNYADTLMVDKLKSKVIYKQFTKEYQYTGSETFYRGGDNLTDVYRYYASPPFLTVPMANGYGWCTHLPRIEYGNKQGVVFGQNNTYAYFFLDKTTYPSIDSVKAWITEQATIGSPVKIMWVTETPTEYDLTNTDLGRELLSLANATQNATNIITVTSSIPTSKLDVNYAEWGGR